MDRPTNIFTSNKSSFDQYREYLIDNNIDYQWSELEEGGYVIHVPHINPAQLKRIEELYFE